MDVEIQSHLESYLLSEYITRLVHLAEAVDPDGFDANKVARVVEKLKSYNEDPNTVFLILKTGVELFGFATLFVKDKYNYVAQLACDPETYEETIVEVLRYLLKSYPNKTLYGIVKTSIAQAMRAYESLGAVREEEGSKTLDEFVEWKAYANQKEFQVMRV